MTLDDARSEIASTLALVAGEVEDLTVYGFWNDTPFPPAIDVYPGNPFSDGAGFTVPSARVYFTVRARVAMVDPEAGQRLLYRFLDPTDAASVEAALATTDWGVVPEGVSGFTQYADDGPGTVRLMGCEWRVSKFL